MALAKGEKFVRILSVVLSLILIIALILVKVANPNFKLGLFLFISFLIILFFAGLVIGYHFWKKRKVMETVSGPKSDEKLPPAVTIEQARELVHKMIRHPTYCDYIPECQGETNELLGKNVKSYVYSYKGIGVYSGDKYVLVMNRHFPNETLNVLINPTKAEIHRAKTLAAAHPEDEPDIEEVTTENPFTGTTMTTKKVKHGESKKDEAKKEDL